MAQETPQKYTFEFSLEEVNVILNGLGELPAKMSHALIIGIHNAHNNAVLALQKAQAEVAAAETKVKEVATEVKDAVEAVPSFLEREARRLAAEVEADLA